MRSEVSGFTVAWELEECGCSGGNPCCCLITLSQKIGFAVLRCLTGFIDRPKRVFIGCRNRRGL